MRPTGRLHLGHLVGALGNWVPLQEKYDCFYFVADWHALTSDFADTSQLTGYAYETWPTGSARPTLSEHVLHPVAGAGAAELYCCCRWSCRCRGSSACHYKEQQENLKDKDLRRSGFSLSAAADRRRRDA
jgi:tryptophanyl-tRNA synthetase